MQGNTDDVIIGVVVVLVIALMVFFAIATALNERTRSVFVGMVLASVFMGAVTAALYGVLFDYFMSFLFAP